MNRLPSPLAYKTPLPTGSASSNVSVSTNPNLVSVDANDWETSDVALGSNKDLTDTDGVVSTVSAAMGRVVSPSFSTVVASQYRFKFDVKLISGNADLTVITQQGGVTTLLSQSLSVGVWHPVSVDFTALYLSARFGIRDPGIFGFGSFAIRHPECRLIS